MLHTVRGTKAISKGWKSGLVLSFGQFPCAVPWSGSAFLMRIRIKEQNHFGSASEIRYLTFFLLPW